MTALFGDESDDVVETGGAVAGTSGAVASTLVAYAQDAIQEAVTDAVVEAERQRTRRSWSRRAAGWLTGVGLGVVLGYRLRGGEIELEFELPDAEDLPDVEELAGEAPQPVAEAVGRQRRTRRDRVRDAAPKAGAAGAAAVGLYLLRRRSSGPREMVEEATQRRRAGTETGPGGEDVEVGATGGDVEEPEAVAGGPDDAGRFETETAQGMDVSGGAESGDEFESDEESGADVEEDEGDDTDESDES